jgi:hypothetical protein
MALIRRMAPMPAAPPKHGPPPVPVEAGTAAVAVDDRVRPGLAPPLPSAQWRMRHDYAAGRADLDGAAVRRAWVNYQRWQARWGALIGEVQEWCAREGLFGADAQAAHAAYVAVGRKQRQADAAVTAAKAGLDQTKAELVEAVRQADGEELPSGRAVLSAQGAVYIAEAVAAAAKQSDLPTRQAWSRFVQRADWPGALAQAQRLDSDEARLAAVWIAAKLDPPLDPSVDPAAWW